MTNSLIRRTSAIVVAGLAVAALTVSSASAAEQTLNVGSQSSGAGAGKVTFNPFSIVRN